MAKTLLTKLRKQRTLSKSSVAKWANVMRQGKWKINGEAIGVYKNGDLANGQHRLNAVIKAGIPVKFTFAFDIEDDVTVFDEGRKRSISDRMKLMGEEKSLSDNAIVAMAQLHFSVKEYLEHETVSSMDYKATNDEVIDFILRNQEVISHIYALTVMKSGGSGIKIKKAFFLVALFHALNAQSLSLEDANAFCQIAKNGLAQSSAEHSAVIFRNDLLLWQKSEKSTLTKIQWVFRAEKALSDFSHRFPRCISYRNWNKPIYSQLPVNLNA